LFPGYFAMVMATGIVAVGASNRTSPGSPTALYAIAAITYVVLAVLLTWRLLVASKLLAADITSHAKGFAFLTTVAATNVLGSASGVIHNWWALAWGLWWFSLALWAFFVYATLFAVVLKGPNPASRRASTAPGSCSPSSTESVVVLGALLPGTTPQTISSPSRSSPRSPSGSSSTSSS
jgi:tellurite resistance protein TehA-like permease